MITLTFSKTKNIVWLLIFGVIFLFMWLSFYNKDLMGSKVGNLFNYTIPVIEKNHNIDILNQRVKTIFTLYFKQNRVSHLDIKDKIKLNIVLAKIIFKGQDEQIAEFEKSLKIFDYYINQYKLDATGDSSDNIKNLFLEHSAELIESLQNCKNKDLQDILEYNLKIVEKKIFNYSVYDVSLLLYAYEQLQNNISQQNKLSQNIEEIKEKIARYNSKFLYADGGADEEKLYLQILEEQKQIKENIDKLKVELQKEIDNSYADIKNTINDFNILIALMSLISILLVAISSYLLNKKLLEPIDKLRAGIKNYADGNTDYRILIENDKDFTFLANEMNNMADTIAKSQLELTHLNAELEERIDNEIQKSRKKDEMIQQQSRLAQMGEMISMIAHQWRQPLGAISSSVIGIQSKIAMGKFDLNDAKDKDKFLAFLAKKHKNISEYIKFLSTTIDDFRNFFKPDKQKEFVNLTLPIKRALGIVQVSMSNKGISIETDFKTDEKIEVYQNELMQVILNILKNSEDNFKEQKTPNANILVRIFEEEKHHIISITDNGGGIPENIVPKIFNPYFSTKSEKNGTGLGLYMSKIIIEEHHHGELSMNNKNDGVEFIIKLIS